MLRRLASSVCTHGKSALLYCAVSSESVGGPFDVPLSLFRKDGFFFYMNITAEGLQNTKVRHVARLDWETELGLITVHVETLHDNSREYGWIIRHGSHKAMVANVSACTM